MEVRALDADSGQMVTHVHQELSEQDVVMLSYIDGHPKASRSTIVYHVDELLGNGHPRVNCHRFWQIDHLLTRGLLYRDGVGCRLTEAGYIEYDRAKRQRCFR
jgi:hypothetical protein